MFTIIFSVTHPEKQSQDILGALELAPDRCQEKGAQRMTPKGRPLEGRYNETKCSFSKAYTGSNSLGNEIDNLLNHLMKRKDFLREITATGGSILLYVHLPGARHRGFMLSDEQLLKLVEIGAKFGFEVFPDWHTKDDAYIT
ncbi:MAG: DUF4279 domain-containing protein [Pseudomonadota bacterium]